MIARDLANTLQIHAFHGASTAEALMPFHSCSAQAGFTCAAGGLLSTAAIQSESASGQLGAFGGQIIDRLGLKHNYNSVALLVDAWGLVLASSTVLTARYLGVAAGLQDSSSTCSANFVAFSTAKAECPVGSAPSLPLIRVFGPSTGTGFVLTYKDHAGNTEHTLTLSGAAAVMSSTENIQIDCELATVTHSDGANLLSVLSTGSNFFSLDPQDAAGSTGPYPTVQISAAGVSGDILYRRAFL